MERIQDKEMVLVLDNVLKNELEDFVGSIYFTLKITAFDFELWKQDDDTVYLIDFDKFTFSREPCENNPALLLSQQFLESKDKTFLS